MVMTGDAGGLPWIDENVNFYVVRDIHWTIQMTRNL